MFGHMWLERLNPCHMSSSRTHSSRLPAAAAASSVSDDGVSANADEGTDEADGTGIGTAVSGTEGKEGDILSIDTVIPRDTLCGESLKGGSDDDRGDSATGNVGSVRRSEGGGSGSGGTTGANIVVATSGRSPRGKFGLLNS